MPVRAYSETIKSYMQKTQRISLCAKKIIRTHCVKMALISHTLSAACLMGLGCPSAWVTEACVTEFFYERPTVPEWPPASLRYLSLRYVRPYAGAFRSSP